MSCNCIEYVCVHVNDDGSKDFQCVTLGKGLRVKKDWGSGKNPLLVFTNGRRCTGDDVPL